MRFPRLLTCFLAVSALVIGTVVSATAATASVSASGSSSASIAKAAVDPVSAGMVKSTLAGFEAGNIISDAVFTNAGTMSEEQIQAFFNSKVSSCQSGYVCIKDFRITSVTRPADAYCKGYTGAANESAARIIYRVAQSCNINPQVLIVMLQKEQGLITHTWPSAWRYNIALGQGCPDTAPCDPNYIGFFHQIYGAARQMQIYMEGKWFQWYAPGRTWNILYNPNANCGSSPVYIANKATSALYYYTPYQPNAAAMRAGYGEGDGCSAYGNRNFYNYFTDWFGSTQGGANNPFGNIEMIEARPGEFAVSGWAIDPNTSASLSVHVYVGDVGRAFTADEDRPDVGAVYPGAGNKHGFSARVPAAGSGDSTVCVYAMNAGPGANVLLGCKRLASLSGPPAGAVESIKPVKDGFEVTGWAVDPDTASPIEVHLYIGGVGRSFTANVERTDLPAAYRPHGTKHGFKATIPAGAGVHTICAYAINVGPGANSELGCSQNTHPGTVIEDRGRAPIGAFESLTSTAPGTVTATGWVLDPDTAAPARVHLYEAGVGREFLANKSRPDVGAANPGYGDGHGFEETLKVSGESATVCAYGINNGAGGNTELGCKKVTVNTQIPEQGRMPVGALDSVVVSGTTAVAKGWTVDPDTRSPIKVHLYVGSIGREFTADKNRADVGTLYPGYGTNHGFEESVPLPAGKSTVCAYGINTGPGGHTLLGCKEVNVTSGIQERGRMPIGSFEALQVSGNTVTASGWAIDPDTASSIKVHLYVAGVGREYSADKARADVGGANPGYGDAHGFSESFTVPNGTTGVCAYAINTGPGGHTLLGCKSVTITAPVQDRGRAPFGNYEALQATAGGAIVAGWAIDPDTTDPIAVHIYVDGVGSAYTAALDRPDVLAAYPGTGLKHGFYQTVPMSPGNHGVCVYAINNGAGGHTLLGCKNVVVP